MEKNWKKREAPENKNRGHYTQGFFFDEGFYHNNFQSPLFLSHFIWHLIWLKTIDEE